MAVVSLRTLATVLVVSIAASGLLMTAGAWWVADRVAASREEWRAYRDANSPQAIALVDLGTHLGYGGAVHHLKNYVLRGDPAYAERLRNSAGGVRAALDRYRTAAPGRRELAALDTIESVLADLESAAADAQAMHAADRPVSAIHDATRVEIEPALGALRVLEEAVSERHGLSEERPSKLEVLYELRRSIGFGGMIHAFKDLVLAPDPARIDAVHEAIRSATAYVRQYRGLGVTDSEAEALADIQSVLDAYGGEVATVLAMSGAGADVAAIDAATDIDDGPALSGFATLELAIAREAGVRSGQIDRTLGFVATLSSALVLAGLVVGAGVCGFVAWVLVRSVQMPLTRIADGMNRVATGDTDGVTPVRSRIAEVSALADATAVFQGYAVDLAQHASTLRQFQQLSTDVSVPLEQRIARILTFGLAHFGLSLGSVSRTADGAYVVEHSVGAAEPARRPGDRFDLETTYCRHTLDAGRAWADHDMASGAMADALCFRTFGRRAYIGAPVHVEGELYGTINFSSMPPRPRPFTKADLALVELMGRWLGMELERQRALNRLASAKADAEDAARAKAEFLANMSHEIRTPMNAVIGLSGLALRNSLPERARDYVEKINRSSRTLLRIINDILDFSKIEAGRLSIEATPFDLDDVLQDVATLIGDLQEDKPVEVVFSSDPAIPRTLVGDPLRLGQILVNLVSNALKFTETGEIVVRIVLDGRDGGRLRLKASVSDTGIGMSPEQVGQLFKAFSQADGSTTRRFGGTGLGLAISRQLVELMGGRITVDSTPGAGSTFTFTLSVGDAGTAPRREVPQHVDPARTRILVVEDNAVARAILLDTLKGLRFTDVEAAADGQSAVLLFGDAARRGVGFDVVLVDWQMPGMDGIDTARRLRELSGSDGRPAILLMTAHTRAEVFERSRDAAILKVLFKPLNMSMLVDGIAEALQSGPGTRTAGDDRPPPDSSRLRGFNVLVVEDNEINQQIAREILLDAGAEVDVAENGAVALTHLRRSERLPDAVLMDLQMPELDGYEATRWIRADERFTDIPIIAMTAHVTAEERARCLAAGMVDHVAKPVEVRRLLEAVERWARPPGTRPEPQGAVAAEYFSVDRPDGGSDGRRRPTLDLEAARARSGVPMPVIERAVRQFADGFRDAPAVLARQFDRQAWTEAERYAHSMVGLAATIGAEVLSAEARVIETALRDPQRRDRPDLSALERAHQAAMQAIDGLMPTEGPEPTAKPAAAVEGSLGDIVREMDAGLATNRISVRRRFDDLRALCRDDAGRDLDRLAADLARLDFPAARRHLRTIATLHAVDLEPEEG